MKLRLITSRAPACKGLTLIEVLVVCAILAVLASLLLMAVSGVREGVRRVSCGDNLRQVMLGVQNYVVLHRVYPAGNDSRYSYSLHTRILPFVGEEAIFNSLDFGQPFEGQRSAGGWKTPAIYQCPTDPSVGQGVARYACNYIGIAGGSLAAEENGVFISGYLGAVSPASITDGLSNTIAMTESRSYHALSPRSAGRMSHATYKTTRRYALPDEIVDFISECDSDEELPIHGRGLGADWMFGSLGVTRLIAVLPRQSRNCANDGSLSRALLAPTSNHAGGYYAVTASGSVHFLSGSMTAKTWRALCGASDRQVVFTR